MDENHRVLLARASGELQAGRMDSAERLYRRVLEHHPRDAEATHFLGLCLVQSGRGAEGFELMRRAMTLDPAQPMFAQNAALALSQAGRPEEAESVLRGALAAAPGAASLHNALGVVLQGIGAWHAARRALEQAVALSPADDSLQNNLGYVLLECGEIDAALGRLAEALRLNPRNVMAHNNLGNARRAKGDPAGAEASYRQAIALAPQFAGGYYNLGKLQREQGDLEAALGSLRACVRLAPHDPGCWQLFADTLAPARFRAPDAGMEADLAACLRRDDVEPTNLALAALSLLRTDAAFESLLQEARDGRSGLSDAALRASRRPLFRLLLENALVTDAAFERLVGALRRSLLRAARDPGFADPDAVELACALAQQCFLAEYVLEETPEESALLDGMAKAPSRPGRPELALALYAAYRPLATHPAADDIPAAAPDSPFGRLRRRQLAEPAEERRLRAEIETLTAEDDAISRAVRDQYEQNPYPRWHRAPGFVGAFPLGAKLRTLFPRLAPEEIETPDELAVLIAGCGTGRHAAITARQHPNARILAVDLSEASLAFAMRRFGELGIANVRFAKADLLRLGSLEERFDLVECAGVLHHLDDPLAGWRVLLGLLRPRGFMSIALYSEAGRAAIVAARRFIAARGFAATPAGMRAARLAIMALPQGAPERGVLDLVDFYSMSGCRDLLFHAKEHRYTPARIGSALAELDLELLGFELHAPAVWHAYRARFPDDPAGVNLGNWALFEADHPDTFASMYHFWVRWRGPR
jgi:Flp pilus assembly protein TadD/SAM-dependent methyltransferase